MLKLLGLVLIAVGFALRWNGLLVVLLAAVLTGLLAGLSPNDVMGLIGEAFLANRYIILPLLLMLPLVGLLERHGLREHMATLVRRFRAASPGGVLWGYQVLRELTSTLGLSIGNHASMVRPLVVPLAEGAAAPERSATATEAIRAHAAAAENTGNFFADDILVAIGALLLIQGVFETVGVDVALPDLQRWCVPTAGWVLLVGWWRFRALDRRLRRTREYT